MYEPGRRRDAMRRAEALERDSFSKHATCREHLRFHSLRHTGLTWMVRLLRKKHRRREDHAAQ